MEHSYRFFQNKDCKYYPCHERIEAINCLFCYCPLYHMEPCPGTRDYVEIEGRKVKVCTNCTFPHKEESYEKIIQILGDNNTPISE
ncbi:MAG: metal-binding protein [Lachnospiraceae bacterium]|nr:metal-binding protein [Lachnospiraceae bacterium]